MSVASLSGYLANNGGGGGSTYYDYKLSDNTEKVNFGTLTILFSGQIIPPPGVYLISTNIFFQGYDNAGNLINILAAIVTVTYYNGSHGNHTGINNLSLQAIEASPNFDIQTCGVFTSNGIGQIIVSVTVLEMENNGTQYNILTSDTYLPQVQLVKIA